MKKKVAKSFSKWIEQESKNGGSIKEARKITAKYEKPLYVILSEYKA